MFWSAKIKNPVLLLLKSKKRLMHPISRTEIERNLSVLSGFPDDLMVLYNTALGLPGVDNV